jgi:hypothetical protein
MSRASSLHSADSPRIQRRSRYFQAMSMLLLGVVLIGFGKTFFLRSLFQVPPIQWYVYVHALMQTAWFGLLVLQTTLVSANRTDVHRRFGVFGALLAVAVAGLSLVTVLGLPRHFSSGQLSIDVPFDLEGITNIFWNDLGSLVIFVVLVETRIHRQNPDIGVHHFARGARGTYWRGAPLEWIKSAAKPPPSVAPMNKDGEKMPPDEPEPRLSEVANALQMADPPPNSSAAPAGNRPIRTRPTGLYRPSDNGVETEPPITCY